MGAWAKAAALAVGLGCGVGKTFCIVDQIEDGRALVLDEHGRATRVDVARLPEWVREGDVVADGKRDEQERVRLESEARRIRRRLSSAESGGALSLESP